MKKRFLVSPIFIDQCTNESVFLAEPFIYYFLKNEEKLNKYNDIEMASFTRDSKEELENDANYITKKWEKYIPILTERLNKIHKKNYPVSFWKKSLSLAFIRYLTGFYDTYKIIHKNFNTEKHNCFVLNENCYYIPKDFEDHRYCFLNSPFGQEQIFSIYINSFYPDQFSIRNATFNCNLNNEGLKLIPRTNKEVIKNTFIYKGIKNIYYRILKKKNILKYDIVVGTIGCYFSTENFSTLINKSQKKIYPIDWTILLKEKGKIFFYERTQISSFSEDFDNFDKFFFNSLKYCFPKSFVENFNLIEQQYLKLIKDYKSLKYIVAETWISNTYSSILIALLQKRGVIHIFNEHNGFLHPFSGKYFEHVINLCDIYATLGWSDSRYLNLINTASLFAFTFPPKEDIKYKILFISGCAGVKMQHFSSAWGYFGENALKSIAFTKSFFNFLNEETLSIISYRAYPKENLTYVWFYNKEYILKDEIRKLKEVTCSLEQSKYQMRQSGLIIIDYFSTGFIECMRMNIPFIFFWDEKTWCLKDEYSDFFTPLVNVNICQSDSIKAAIFVEKIKDNPGEWWFSEATQAGRKEFMDKNLGEPQVMLDYLLSLVNQPASLF